ncbi:hypothetical protein B0H16DRAFT_1691103 [Mycena metata]|uniref:Uncharacterized protein n=1 Tax=Mycena metata TaxID=1033252 RepID=A0AAD7J195_9AGAR|nr:hypothetical protein B0H16DRAFT_1691103 [Mycena metata]
MRGSCVDYNVWLRFQRNMKRKITIVAKIGKHRDWLNSAYGTSQRPRGTGASITQPPPRQCRVTARQCRGKSRQARHFLPAREGLRPKGRVVIFARSTGAGVGPRAPGAGAGVASVLLTSHLHDCVASTSYLRAAWVLSATCYADTWLRVRERKFELQSQIKHKLYGLRSKPNGARRPPLSPTPLQRANAIATQFADGGHCGPRRDCVAKIEHILVRCAIDACPSSPQNVAWGMPLDGMGHLGTCSAASNGLKLVPRPPTRRCTPSHGVNTDSTCSGEVLTLRARSSQASVCTARRGGIWELPWGRHIRATVAQCILLFSVSFVYGSVILYLVQDTRQTGRTSSPALCMMLDLIRGAQGAIDLLNRGNVRANCAPSVSWWTSMSPTREVHEPIPRDRSYQDASDIRLPPLQLGSTRARRG